MNMEPGFSDNVFMALSMRFQNKSDTDRYCVLCVDDMAIQRALEFDQKRDLVDGFDGDGVHRSPLPGTEALVFMARGLVSHWKQPLCYFISAGPSSSNRIGNLVLQCIAKLQAIGLHVKAVICDQGANNRGMFANFKVTVEKPFIEVNGERIIFMYDPPHLLKSIQNNSKCYPVEVNGKVALWYHVVQFYSRDSKLPS